ncbi:penicillin-binding protein [Actinomycetes bacterium M1A6_2h]
MFSVLPAPVSSRTPLPTQRRVLRPRYVIALLVAFAVMAATATAIVSKPRSEAAVLVENFAHALDERNVAAAAALTSYPNAAAQTITQMFDGLGPTGVSSTRMSQYIGLDETSGFFTLDTTWTFGEPRGGDTRQWHFTTQGSTRKLAVGWKISWAPEILAPDLGNGRTVAFTRTDAPAPTVLDASGEPMMSEQAIARVDLDPAAMTDPASTTQQLADVIDVVAPLITSETMLAELAAAQGKPVTAVTLRADDYAVLEDDLRAIPGVTLYTEPRLIAADRRLNSPLLDSLRNVWQQTRDDTAGWAVDVASPDGTSSRKAGFQGPGAPDIASTVDSGVQLAAETAVVSVGTPASIVAITPSTGAVVAVAQNSYANELGTPALNHLYPAGTVSELIDASASMQGSDFSTAARQFGLGTSYSLPGADVVTASLPDGRSRSDQFRSASSSSKQDAMAVTPFGLAEMAAAISRGSAPAPMIVNGRPASVSSDGGPVDPAVLARVRSSMTELDGHTDVRGLGGGNAEDDHWYVATRGDLAFAVLVENAGDADQAVRMTNLLLQEMASPTE